MLSASLHKQRGAAAVELGILLFPLLLIAFGATEFGRAMAQYNTLAKSTRDAARYLSTFHPGADAATLAAARCLVLNGNTTCSGNLLLPGLTSTMVKICDSVDDTACPGIDHSDVGTNPPVHLVTVRVDGYTFQSMVPFVTGAITIPVVATTMRQVL